MKYQLQDVSLIYDMDKEGGTAALQNISLSLDAKGFVGILGPSGSGKSSLLYTMAGLKIPTSGKVLYGDSDFSVLGVSDLAALRRQRFGFIFQQHFLIHYMTVLENILVPLNVNTRQARDKALHLLQWVEMEQYAGRRPYQLSGGQRQRVAIVRALMNDPQVIYGDEPTAALDHDSAMLVMDLLGEYAKQIMVAVVTHDENILETANMKIHLKDGRIATVSDSGQGANI